MQDEYPADAQKQGVSGRAMLQCALAPDGRVTDCVTESEQPAGFGFGSAARRLAPQFRMTTAPCRADGCGQVRIPVIFQYDATATPAARQAAAAAAWTQLTQFLARAGTLLLLGLGILLWALRTPEEDLSAIRSAVGGDGRTVLTVRRRGQMTHRPAGGVFRTYNVVVRASDGDERVLMIGVARRLFGTGAVTEFDSEGRLFRALPGRAAGLAMAPPSFRQPESRLAS